MTHSINPWSRRRVLGAGLAGTAVAVAGCASPAGSGKPRVVVVGGGWGGLGAARTLARDGKAQVTLVEPNGGFMSCPLSAHYIAGWQPASDFQRSYDAVDRAGIERVRDRVQTIDRAGSAVVTAAGKRIGYDFLVLSPGIEYMEEAIAGYAQARDQLPVGFRAFEQTAVREQVERFLAKGGTYVISVPAPPARCPPAPYERAFLIAEQMRRKGVKGKIVLLDASPAPVPPPIAKPLLGGIKHYAAEIDYIPNAGLTAVDIGRRTLATAMGDVPFTEANLVLPQRAPALIRQAGLGERFAAVKLPSFQTQADEKIYVIGDSAGVPLPKSGHVAFGAGVQVARDIGRRIAGQPAPAPSGTIPLPPGICWAAVTHDQAIMINVVATMEPGQPPKSVFNVDPEHNAASGKGSMEWGRQMWSNMLG